MAILIKNSFPCAVQNTHSSQDGRLLKLDLKVRDKSFSLTTLYCPNHNLERDIFLNQLEHMIDPCIDNLFFGDFDTVFDKNLDRRSCSPLHSSHDSSDLLKSIFEKSRLLDIWRFLHPTQHSFTYRTPDHNAASRIDVIGVPVRFAPSVVSCDFLFCPHSDHSVVLLECNIPDLPSGGPSYWKLNISILSEDEYFLEISEFWKHWQQRKQYYQSPLVWWDLGKHHIKEISIKYCSKRKKQAQAYRNSLQQELSLLQNRVDNGDTSSINNLQFLKLKLVNLDSEEAKASKIRARAKWIEEGETSSAFFFSFGKAKIFL